MKPISDHSKFSWGELFSDQNGKTSGTAFTGIIICIVGTICFLLGCIDKMWISKSIDIITQSITFVLIGASLMGLRKVVGSKGQSNIEEESPTSVSPTSKPVDSSSPITKPEEETEPIPNPAAFRDN